VGYKIIGNWAASCGSSSKRLERRRGKESRGTGCKDQRRRVERKKECYYLVSGEIAKKEVYKEKNNTEKGKKIGTLDLC